MTSLLAPLVKLLILWQCLYLAFAQRYNKKTSDICILPRDCPSIKGITNYAEIESRICGYDDRYAKIWCTVDCFTPDGDKGVCTPSTTCKPFNEIYKNSNPNSAEDKKYLRKFVCLAVSGIRKHYVCCADAPTRPQQTTPQYVDSTTPQRKPSFSNNQQCGIASEQYKVVEGELASIGEHPWLVQLQYISNGVKSIRCGGTLINNRYVVTAAHCIEERVSKLTNVILGEHNTSSPIDCLGKACAPKPKVIRVEKIIQHPGWVNGSPQFYHDIALLRLAQNVEFSDFIKPICLTSPKYIPTRSTELVVAGWGRTETDESSDVKRKATLYLQPSSSCLNTVRIPLITDQLCVGGGKVDTCSGDSGGPLMMSVDHVDGYSVWHLVGVISFGYNQPCGTTGKPGIYTFLPRYLTWIQQNIY